MPSVTTTHEFTNTYENAKIIDYRDPTNPNNTVLITCEHATNDLPEGYSWSEHDKRHFANEHWGLDIGAYKMANALAAELKCVFVHSVYSRLFVDVNRSIVADSLFRKSGDGREVELNKGITHEEQQYRIRKYYLSYYEALREISLKVDPTYVFSVHSFTPSYEGQVRRIEVGSMTEGNNIAFSEEISIRMKKKGYVSELNEPYDGLKALGAIKTLIFAKQPVKRQGVTLEFRNDILSERERFVQLKMDMVDVIEDTCGLNNKIDQ